MLPWKAARIASYGNQPASSAIVTVPLYSPWTIMAAMIIGAAWAIFGRVRWGVACDHMRTRPRPARKEQVACRAVQTVQRHVARSVDSRRGNGGFTPCVALGFHIAGEVDIQVHQVLDECKGQTAGQGAEQDLNRHPEKVGPLLDDP